MIPAMERYFLFANPSLIEGMARVLDLGSTLNDYNNSLSPEDADCAAISSDWKVVALDMKSAMAEYERQSTPYDEK